MRKYWALFKIGFQNTICYRGVILFWLLGNTAALIVMIAVWFSVTSGQTIGGYTRDQLITYYIISLVLQWVVGWHPADWVAEKIRNGEMISDGLLKPVLFYKRAFLTDLGWHTVAIPIGLLVSSVFCLIFKDNLFIVTNFNSLFLVFLSCFFAVLLTFTIGMCIAYLGFWFTEVSMMTNIYWAAMGIFGGHVIPVSFFPLSALKIIDLLPFRYTFSFPLELYFGQLSTAEIWRGFGIEIFWLAIALLLHNFLWREGTKIYHVWGQ